MLPRRWVFLWLGLFNNIGSYLVDKNVFILLPDVISTDEILGLLYSGHIVQSVESLIADPGAMRLRLPQSHTFVKIYYEIVSSFH